MIKYEEGLQIMERVCGNGKESIVDLATIAIDLSADNTPYPVNRALSSYYEDGVFYVVTWGESNKMLQIAQNKNVAFSLGNEGINGSATGENLGWVLDPKNAELRAKLRKTFAAWYDDANNEQDKNCVILAIHLTTCKLFRDDCPEPFTIDFVNKTIA